jgi:Co/Zn/Cd efflux system component
MTRHKLDKVRRYRWALIITFSVWVLQLVTFALIARSLTLFGDMAHSFSDIIVLFGTFWIFANEVTYPQSEHHSHGKKIILVRIAALLLCINAVYVFVEALARIEHPVDFPGWPVFFLACVSALGNFFAHRIIHGVDKSEHDHVHDANVAHLLTDLALSLAVLFSALGNILFKLPAIDAWLSLIVAVWMLRWGWKLNQSTTVASAQDMYKDEHDHY